MSQLALPSLSERHELQASLRAQIDQGRDDLIPLLRARNSLSPLLSLSADIVLQILKLIIWSEKGFEFDPEPETAQTEIGWQGKKPFYHWVSAAQFCSQWRDLAMEFPELWVRIDGRNVKWAEEFVRRSKDRPLHVDTRQRYKYVKSETLINNKLQYEFRLVDRLSHRKRFEELVLSQAHRIRCLYVCNWFAMHKISEMPRLEMMEMSNFAMEPWDEKYWGNMEGPEENFHHIRHVPSLPKLRWLKLNICDLFTMENRWGQQFPETLPSLTTLYVNYMPRNTTFDPTQIAKRCPNLEFLSLRGSYSSRKLDAPISLPSLQRLEYISADSMKLFALTGNTHIKITGTEEYHRVDACVTKIMDTLKPILSNNVTHFDICMQQRDKDLSVDLVGKRMEDEACSITHKIALRGARDTKKFINCFQDQLRIAYSISFTTITAVSVTEFTHLESLVESVLVTNLILGGTLCLTAFLRFLDSRRKLDCPSASNNDSQEEHNAGNCQECRSYSFTAFPGLECLELRDISFAELEEATLGMLLDFVGRRVGEKQTIRVQEVRLMKTCADVLESYLNIMREYVRIVDWH